MDFDPSPALSRVRVPMVFFFGETDRWVPVDTSAARIAEATRANPDVSIIQILGADHFMTDQSSGSAGTVSKKYIELMLDWIRVHTKN